MANIIFDQHATLLSYMWPNEWTHLLYVQATIATEDDLRMKKSMPFMYQGAHKFCTYKTTVVERISHCMYEAKVMTSWIHASRNK